MGTRESSWRRMRVRAPAPAPAPAALVLASLLLVGSSSWAHVAHGVRTTPHAYAPTTGAAAEVPAGASRGTYQADPDERAEDTAAAAGTPLVVVVEQRALKEGRVATGSRPPDCAHACGPCSPCRRVMVSFRCAQASSESCPVAYRCMCRGRFFRVPSL
ncbi:hypothetical protein BS78_06G119600 [Paspalum vaginatum]|nr:hypothetical protein BS78_06G119600 [Paspalum vaginatum]